MEKQTIKFNIRQDGLVSEEVIGVVGNTWQDLTKSKEEKLGEVTYIETKPEHYLAQPIDNFWKQQTDVTLQHNQNENKEQA